MEDRLNLKFNSHFASKISVRNGSSQPFLSKWIPPGAVSPVASPCGSSFEDNLSVLESQCSQVEFNRVEYLVRVLHESARSFSVAMQSLEVAGTGPPLAMAWNGVDVHAWHKHVAYQVSSLVKSFAFRSVEVVGLD